MDDLWLVIVVTSAICGIAGYIFAKKTGRDPKLWLALGVFLNVLVIALLSMRSGRSVKRG
jgi:hypothetical protein